MPYNDEPLNFEEAARLQHLDEQIDQRLHTQTQARNDQDALDPALLRDLQEVYQPRSQAFQQGLDRVWGRLEARGVTLAEPAQPPAQPVPSAGTPQEPLRSMRWMAGAGRRWSSRLSVLIAAVLLVVLVVGLTAVPMLVHRPGPDNTGASPTPAHSQTVNFTSIHMIDETNGWAQGSTTDGWRLLHTSDGGARWQDVTPLSLPGPQGELPAYYLNASDAWIVVSLDTTVVFRTVNGGQSWQRLALDRIYVVRQLVFVTSHLGWLLSTQGVTGNELADLLRTTDGGAHWSLVSTTGETADTQGTIPFNGTVKGISFLNASTGWMTAFDSSLTNYFWFYRTQDGGVTWQHQQLPKPPGVSEAQYELMPPTFFNAQDGVMPVQVDTPEAGASEMDVYVTHDGGVSWQPTALVNASDRIVSFIDASHGWVTDGLNLYSTSDGGQHWTQLPVSGESGGVQSLNFVSNQIGWAILAPGTVPELLKTTDGGKTWKVVTPQV